MHIIAKCHGETFDICVGDGRQHIRWLGLVVSLRFQQKVYPHAFRIPLSVTTGEGISLRPRMQLVEELKDGDEVIVELRDGASTSDKEGEEDLMSWQEEAYGAQSNLRICKFQWKQKNYDSSIPVRVRGDYFVATTWLPVFPQKEYGGKFEIPLDPIDTGDGNIDWVAVKRAPPGSAYYRFIMEDGSETICKGLPERRRMEDGSETICKGLPERRRMEDGSETICKGLPEHTLSSDGSFHQEDFPWDVPIAADPHPDVDSRPSTASSADGVEVDPRFDEDWESLKLRWIEPHMTLRVKDVVKEFYSILLDLYDSYAFMGLDLAVEDPMAQSSHTIGFDDIVHLLLQANLVSKGSYVPKNPKMNLMPIPWTELVKWYEETTQIRDGKPYLSQRLQRNHYLEMLLRVSHWTMCEHSAQTKQSQTVQMPLDEGLFRFLTDILIPVMDVYDDDPVRKDAVQHENLVAIQRARPNLRSIYSFLAQQEDEFGERVLTEDCIKFVWEFGLSLVNEPSEEDQYLQVFQQELGRLGEPALNLMIEQTEDIVGIVCKNHLEPDAKSCLFWEFFELIMHYSRNILSQREGGHGGLHTIITQVVGLLSAIVKLIDARGVALPGEGGE